MFCGLSICKSMYEYSYGSIDGREASKGGFVDYSAMDAKLCQQG